MAARVPPDDIKAARDASTMAVALQPQVLAVTRALAAAETSPCRHASAREAVRLIVLSALVCCVLSSINQK